MPSYTFTKAERLKSKKIIDRIFNREGKSFGMYPLRLIWLETPLNTTSPAQFTLSVPKRNFKKAVDRNRLRRQIREAYRLNKHKLYDFLEDKELQCAFMVLYTGKKAVSYQEIEQKIEAIISRFIKIQIKKEKNRKLS